MFPVNSVTDVPGCTLKTNGIVVKADDKVVLEGHAVLSDDGACRLRVNGEDLEFWQFRKRALEALFFRL
jgi:hypothetical protein